ncbi:MAG: protein-export chaperone SecB [Gallionellales bacterium RIFCSPLOWO2_12_FULL_59_22]|nr:MAG: protein-export chaperone SecB [Gallionellales bacterium RIFCSPLOWO2_02_FULL_59_110]OGT03217.1 MAG: protein-export chaperone SecB [Gallionellales bacterium RIFCSPLOWO2_02_58_13]OGT13820.1 MAG: protein-export chaperone SecB [Gallionellales bacterium RIFCSPLOWO2_12_FULL_59_22]
MTEAVQENSQPMFNIEKLYVRDLSLEIPHAPHIFLERENPQIEVQLNTETATIEADVYEVMITTTVTAKVGEKVMFLIEAKQAGIFRLSNLPKEDMESVLAVMCPSILFPYLREVVSNVAVRAGFSPVMLNPVNFEMLYQQHKQEQAQAAAATTH